MPAVLLLRGCTGNDSSRARRPSVGPTVALPDQVNGSGFGRRGCICSSWTSLQTKRVRAAYYRCSSHLGAKGNCGARTAPADAVEAWAWERVSATLRDPSIIAAELKRRRQEGQDPILIRDLETAKRSLTQIERQQERLLRSFAAEDDDSFPMELVQKEVARMEQEKTQVRATVAELERRIAQQDSALDQLEALSAYCERVARNIDTFGFEEKRLALKALGVRVVANGRDWQLRGSIPLTSPDAVLSHVSRRLD